MADATQPQPPGKEGFCQRCNQHRSFWIEEDHRRKAWHCNECGLVVYVLVKVQSGFGFEKKDND